MRICFVTLGFDPFRTSGLDISGERLVNALADVDQEIVVVAAGHKHRQDRNVRDNVTIYRLPLGALNWIGYSAQASKLVLELTSRQSFDVIHFWDVHFAWRYRGDYIATLHQSFRQRRQTLDDSSQRSLVRTIYYKVAQLFFERPAVRKANMLTAVSSATRHEFSDAYNIELASIQIAKHFIDSDHFKPRQGLESLRRSLEIAVDSRVLLFAGFITHRKGLEDLAEAFAEICVRFNPHPTLVIFGKWQAEDKQRFMHSLGKLSERVRYAGFVPDEELPEYYSLADIYISTSRLEGFGLPLAEAMACETPVVAYDAGAVREVVGPGGVIIPHRSPILLAEHASALLMDPEKGRLLGQRGRKYVMQNFSKDKCIRNYLKVYETFSAGVDP